MTDPARRAEVLAQITAPWPYPVQHPFGQCHDCDEEYRRRVRLAVASEDEPLIEALAAAIGLGARAVADGGARPDRGRAEAGNGAGPPAPG